MLSSGWLNPTVMEPLRILVEDEYWPLVDMTVSRLITSSQRLRFTVNLEEWKWCVESCQVADHIFTVPSSPPEAIRGLWGDQATTIWLAAIGEEMLSVAGIPYLYSRIKAAGGDARAIRRPGQARY